MFESRELLASTAVGDLYAAASYSPSEVVASPGDVGVMNPSGQNAEGEDAGEGEPHPDLTGVGTPYTMGAVGPQQIVEMLYFQYAVFDKSTGVLLTPPGMRTIDFWNTALAAGSPGAQTKFTGDPRVVYDPLSGRWFASILGSVNNPFFPENILLAVSNTSNPLDGWKAFVVYTPPNVDTQHFPDFPQLGVDAEGVYIAANVFYDGEFRTAVISVPKSDLLAAQPNVNETVFSLLNPDVDHYPVFAIP